MYLIYKSLSNTICEARISERTLEARESVTGVSTVSRRCEIKLGPHKMDWEKITWLIFIFGGIKHYHSISATSEFVRNIGIKWLNRLGSCEVVPVKGFLRRSSCEIIYKKRTLYSKSMLTSVRRIQPDNCSFCHFSTLPNQAAWSSRQSRHK